MADVRPLQFDDRAWLPSLRAGNHPSQSERASLESESRALADHVAELHAEEARTRERLAALQAMREQAQRAIECRASYLHSPIRRLPDELLSEIFLYIFPFSTPVKYSGHPPFPTFLRSSYFAPPFVCAWWRDVVVRTPNMQPMIDLDLTSQVPMDIGDGSIADLPYSHLRLCVNAGFVRSNNTPIVPDALASLGAHSARWQELQLNYPSWHVMAHIGTNIELSRLEKLTLTLPDPGSDTPWLPPRESWWRDAASSNHPPLYADAPALRVLELYNRMSGAITKLPFSLPWHQLTDISVNPQIAAQLCVEIINNCTFLQKFAVRDHPRRIGWYMAPPATTETCVYHGEHFTVEVGAIINATPVLDAITAPSLTHLTFSPFKDMRMDPLFRLLERSSCNITHLTLWSASHHPPRIDFEDLIERLPALEYLDLKLGDGWEVVEAADRNRGRALVEALCALRRAGALSALRVLKFASPDFYEHHILTILLPAFVHDNPVRELWLETPLKSQALWEDLLPSLMEKVELYGIQHSFNMPGPSAVLGEAEPIVYEDYDEDWDDRDSEHSEEEYDAFY